MVTDELKALDEFLTPKEMANVLRTPLSWIYSKTRQKGKDAIPTVRVGKYIRFQRGKVLEWIKNGGATAER